MIDVLHPPLVLYMRDGFMRHPTDMPLRGYRVKLVYVPEQDSYNGYWTYPNRPERPTSTRVGISPNEVVRSTRSGAWVLDVPAHVALPQGV